MMILILAVILNYHIYSRISLFINYFYVSLICDKIIKKNKKFQKGSKEQLMFCCVSLGKMEWNEMNGRSWRGDLIKWVSQICYDSNYEENEQSNEWSIFSQNRVFEF